MVGLNVLFCFSKHIGPPVSHVAITSISNTSQRHDNTILNISLYCFSALHAAKYFIWFEHRHHTESSETTPTASGAQNVFNVWKGNFELPISPQAKCKSFQQ